MKIFNITICFLVSVSFVFAQNKLKTEENYYKIVTVPVPADIDLEVGGIAVIPDGKVAVSTRKGDIWMISNPYMYNNSLPSFKKFASGLHEPLGLAYIDNKLWATQRGEVTIITDENKDGVADKYKAFYKFPLSGNYHQYSYGPVQLPDGDMIFTLNVDWIGKGGSLTKWRGWMLKISPDGKMTPWATGLRSPAGYVALRNGDILYGENQGDWVGSGRVTHLEKGDFAGNVAGLAWTGEPGSPLTLKEKDVIDSGEPMYKVAKSLPDLKVPAVWFPHTLMGISTSDIIENADNANFGPFENQCFVGDQGHSKIMRMTLEKIDGVYQGACYAFREGFQSGILRLRWGLDQSMFVGMTSRGWASTGKDDFGLQRLVWTGETPFEIKEIKSMPDGFELNFTKPVDSKTLLDPESYVLNSFNYKYHHIYGSPVINLQKRILKAVKVADDNLSARIVLDSLILGEIYEIRLPGVKNSEGDNLLHDFGYYTLNRINQQPGSVDIEKYKVAEVKPMDHSQHAGMDMDAGKMMPAKVSAKRQSAMPEEWYGKVDQTISIGTKPGLKFNVSSIQVKAGAKVKLTFNNNDDMLHNLLIVKPGTVDKVGMKAFDMGLDAEKNAYVPNMDEVLFHTWILQPESSETIYFTAPEKPGKYTFVCTFPGHYTLMQGTINVVK
ncbi:auracyanin family protein [Lacihabitans sp. LS3-19]|uniref:plastocyanin/azurin family copper-binding protein n=1 Tax=Lacihabitans sp. LS3-19 TaxID=2487335 RepID=UPI0020CD6AA6|nr:plastocyanin/azurin family copper-binding protein [Lacihabitans sp. LS3-19]MCP9769168.1 auracyanin family protein [Lacihabitans sp. LS3-19]